MPFKIVTLILVLLQNTPCFSKPIDNSIFKSYGLSMKDASNWSIESEAEQQEGKQKIQIIKIKNLTSKAIVDMTIIGPVVLAQYNESSKMENTAIQNLYKPMVTPYPGAISKKNICPKSFAKLNQKMSFLGQSLTGTLAKASARGAFGVCDKSLTFYDGFFFTYYLNEKYFLRATFLSEQKNKDSISLLPLQKIIDQFTKFP